MEIRILLVVLLVLCLHAIIKPLFFFFIPYDVRRKQLDKSYGNKTSATGIFDAVILVILLILIALLILVKRMEYVSFAIGLYVGATLIQVYFHSFTDPLPDNKAPKPPLSPIKLMSYAIQASPEKPLIPLMFISILFLWVIYRILSTGLGLF